MSQNKTVFPGVGAEGDYNPNYNQGYSAPSHAYSRPNNQYRGNGTVFPGMGMPSNEASNSSNFSNAGNPQPRRRSSGKPIVGFLYSISRTGVGEFWPLHVGQNIIGNSPECDIVLGEGTVSARHANLHINKMKKPEKTEATISDLGSTNGTCVNENSISVARPAECFDRDIITIGENYDLLLILIDPAVIGLHVSQNFLDVRNEEEEMPMQGMTPPDINNYNANNNHATRNEQDFPPRFHGPDSPYNGSNRPTDSTVGTDTYGGFRSGGTVGME